MDYKEQIKLPETEREGRELKLVFHQNQINVDALTKQDAKQETIMALLSQNDYDIVHFSTHGGTNDSDDNSVSISLSGKEKLTSKDLDKSFIRNISLMFLSICHGGEQSKNFKNSLSGFIPIPN